MKKNYSPLEITIDNGVYTFQDGQTQFKARIKEENFGPSVIFFEFNQRPFDQSTITNPLLYAADAFFQSENIHRTWIEFEKREFLFPIYESLKILPELTEDRKIILELDYYDGPIGGVIKTKEDFYHFSWCMNGLKDDFLDGPRFFALRKIPKEIHADLLAWTEKENELSAEFSVVANPHIYPISDWQKSQMPSLEKLQSTIDEHGKLMPQLDHAPITAWMVETGNGQFASLSYVTVTKEESEYFEGWQKDVALALMAEDQLRLDELFKKKPLHLTSERDIYRVNLPLDANGKSRIILRDHLGQTLPANFWMTSFHSVQDLTHTAKEAKKN
jgi:hypothetical protein